jgi:hypothetical protein
VHLEPPRAGIGVLDAVQVGDAVAIEVAHGKPEIGGIRLGNRRWCLQENDW